MDRLVNRLMNWLINFLGFCGGSADEFLGEEEVAGDPGITLVLVGCRAKQISRAQSLSVVVTFDECPDGPADGSADELADECPFGQVVSTPKSRVSLDTEYEAPIEEESHLISWKQIPVRHTVYFL